MKILALTALNDNGSVRRCQHCDTLYRYQNQFYQRVIVCPRCQGELQGQPGFSLANLGVISILLLLVIPLGLTMPLLEVHLLGMPIEINVWQGIEHLVAQNQLLTAAMIAFTVIACPLVYPSTIIWLSCCRRFGLNARIPLFLLEKLKHWIMLDIYLVGIGVAAVKVQDYAAIQIGYGLVAFIVGALLMLLLQCQTNLAKLWQQHYPMRVSPSAYSGLHICKHCLLTALPDAGGHCRRCGAKLVSPKQIDTQAAWAGLIASILLIIPANLLAISVVFVNQSKQTDTIYSGILSLANDNLAIATIVFLASIVVPFTKIIIMLILLLSVARKVQSRSKLRMRLLQFVKAIGRWSMLDLFVIALTMSLVDRGQLLAFSAGPAALYFGATVFLTLLSTEWLDSRLFWPPQVKGTTDYAE
jgi:paraquat-inducible protein A